MRLDISRTEGRLGALALGAFGSVHVCFPRLLLRTARLAYGLVLDVEFTPRENAPRRVRVVGVLSLVLAAIGWRVADRGDAGRVVTADRR